MKHASNQPAHLRYQTQFSRTGDLNMHNRKPFRTPKQKELARANARVEAGRFVTEAPVSMHGKHRGAA